jgi:hypothetical protein
MVRSLLHALLAIVLSAGVFVIFVPGVLVILPPGQPSNGVVVIAVHATLFALLNHVVLRVLNAVIRAL